MATMDWTLCACKIEVDEYGYILLKQFRVGQIIEHTEATEQSWMIVDVRNEWLKVLPLFDSYKDDPRKHKRFDRMTVDYAFEQGWWRIGENR